MTESAVDQDSSRFLTFEIDTSGKLESFDGWSDGIVQRKFTCKSPDDDDDDDCVVGDVSPPSFTDILVGLFKAQ